MSVLNRKLFNGGVVHLKHGGDPMIDHETGISKVNQLSGIMEGFDEGIVKKATLEGQAFAESLYPTKTKAQYEEEAKLIYDTDFSSQRALVQRQKDEDIAASLIGFGARLMTGRGKALDVLGQAAQETVPELMAARRLTRKDTASLQEKEQTAKKAIQSYALSKKQEDEIARTKLIVDATFNNLDFFQEIAGEKMKHSWNLQTDIVPVKNLKTNINTEITLGDYLLDMQKPQMERQYMKADELSAPFEAYDNTWGVNRLFNNYEAFAVMNKANPRRFEGKKEDLDKVKAMKVGNFTHPATGNYGKMMIQETPDGNYMIPKVDKNGDAILQANGHVEWVPIGTGIDDLVVGRDVELTAADLLPPKVLNEQLSTILLYDRNIRSLDKIIKNLGDDKLRAGITGSVKEMMQIGQGMITDLLDADAKESIFAAVSEEMTNIDRIAETPEDAAAIKALFDPDNPASAKFWGDFDPALAENRTRANAIAYAVARARKTSGRLNLDDIQRAYASLKITGFRDARTAITELYTIRDELGAANDDMKMLYQFNGGSFPDDYVGTKAVKKKDIPILYYNENNDIETILFPWERKDLK